MKFSASSFFCLLASLSAGHAATITWNGAGDGISFNNPANWIGSTTPGAADDAVITSGAGTEVIVVSNTTVLSVTCSKAFTVSNIVFAVTAGSSSINGALKLAAGAEFNATGAGTAFTANGMTTADDANFNIGAAAVVALPNLGSYSKNCVGAYWTVTGAGSVLNLHGLTNLTGQACNYPVIQATTGGTILMTNVTTILAGPLAFQADGTNSLIDLSGLTNCSSPTSYMITFEASDGGTIQLPQMHGGPLIAVTINPGGTIATAQFTQLYLLTLFAPLNCNALTSVTQLTVSGATNSFLSLNNFTDGNISILNGASVTMPALWSYTKLCNGGNWMVSGSNSVLNLPALTDIIGHACNYPVIQAAAGGTILMTNVTSILAGPLGFQADGTNSLIDLNALASVSSQNPNFQVTFEASAGGTLRLPNMTGGPLVGITLNPGGTIPTSQIRSLYSLSLLGQGGNFNALTNLTSLTTTVSINFPALYDFTDGNLSVMNGASVTMSALTNYTKLCNGGYWTVSGSNSMLNLPALTNITGQACNYPVIQAETGGQIILSNVLSIVAGPLGFQADGTNSLIDLSALASVSGQNSFQVTFEASAGGTLHLPNMTGGPLVGVTLNAGGTIPTSQIRSLYSLILPAQAANFNALTNLTGLTTGVSMNFPALFDFTDGNLLITNGTLTMPALSNYAKLCNGGYWTVSGSNSVLNLPALTNITGQACNYPVIQAVAGGQIILSNVLSIVAGPLAFQADGSNSVVNLNRLTACSGQNPYQITFEASVGGTLVASNFAGGPLVGVTLNPGGNLPLAQFRQLFSITANNGAVASFTALTNLDGGSLDCEAGGQIILSALQVVNPFPGCNYAVWQANGSGSQIIAPALTAFVGSDCSRDNMWALAGGQITLSNLSSLNGPEIEVLADGTGSVIDLSHLSSFISATAVLSSLTAQNGGVILLGTQAFLLQNVAINIPAGNPVLPPLTNSGPNLTLFGTAWHSYLIEQLNTSIPGATWQFFLRVPLTNALQEISSFAPPADIAFRLTDFVADPPLLNLATVSPLGVQIVLYGATNKTYELDSATSLHLPTLWTSNAVAVMTNAFRIFPPTDGSGPAKFFRAKQIAP
jgi:hypothetical protein